MNLLLINVLLAIIWAAVTGIYSLLNIAFGFLLGVFALSLISEQVGSIGYFMRLRKVATLALVFLYELILSTIRVAITVLSPNMNLKPGIFAYKLEVDRDFEITILANLITLTPGTLSVDVSDDKQYLYVHAIDCSDVDATRHDIATSFERRILEAFR